MLPRRPVGQGEGGPVRASSTHRRARLGVCRPPTASGTERVSGRAVADPPRRPDGREGAGPVMMRPGGAREPRHPAPASSAGSTTRTSPAALSVMQNTVKYSISGSTP